MTASAAVIVLDIGNGSIKWGRFEQATLKEAGRLPLDADPTSLAADVAVSVNPAVLERWTAVHSGIQVVGVQIPLPLPRGYESCGNDRVCALAGALSEVRAALVLDAGTCLVATAGTREAGVMGGAIAPGPALMARALSEGTALLPHVEYSADASGMAQSTPGAIQAGLDAAHIGATRELISRIRREMGESELFVVSTGTGGESLALRLPEIDAFRPYLPLVGARQSALIRGRSVR